MRRRALAALLLVCMTLLPACSGEDAAIVSADPCQGETSQGLAVSLASSSGGESAPEGAATRQSGRGDWRLVAEDSNGATLTSDRSLRHAVRGADGTWQVDRGHDC